MGLILKSVSTKVRSQGEFMIATCLEYSKVIYEYESCSIEMTIITTTTCEGVVITKKKIRRDFFIPIKLIKNNYEKNIYYNTKKMFKKYLLNILESEKI